MMYGILKNKKVVIIYDVLEWAEAFEAVNRRVAKDVLKDGRTVSTVFLGLDHSFGGTPLWFETMVFQSEDNFIDEQCERYETWEEAEAGHKRIVEELTNE